MVTKLKRQSNAGKRKVDQSFAFMFFLMIETFRVLFKQSLYWRTGPVGSGVGQNTLLCSKLFSHAVKKIIRIVMVP